MGPLGRPGGPQTQATRISRRRPHVRKIVCLAMLGLVAVVGIGCSNTVSKADFKKELDDAGLGGTVDTQCLVDKMEAKGFQFKRYGDLSGNDNQIVTEATKECITVSIPSVPSVPGG